MCVCLCALSSRFSLIPLVPSLSLVHSLRGTACLSEQCSVNWNHWYVSGLLWSTGRTMGKQETDYRNCQHCTVFFILLAYHPSSRLHKNAPSVPHFFSRLTCIDRECRVLTAYLLSASNFTSVDVRVVCLRFAAYFEVRCNLHTSALTF